MKIGVLGTGTVGQTVGGKLASLGHDVRMGSRTRDNEKAAAWVERTGEHASQGTFADAAAFGEIVVNATAGAVSLDALHAAGADNLAGKILLDISNPLDFSQGMPPTLTDCNTDSLGEQIQRAFPDTRVVKSLNTVNARVMVDPGSVRGPHTVFIAGDDHVARWQVKQLLLQFGWRGDAIYEFDDITSARGLEMYLPLWLALRRGIGDRPFNIKVAH